ncbi:AbiV family abortive infection protein [Sulfitobacter pontiacus]|uniref:AbiV family abortive infection protein n=1 Tax=Sulfitobacter pontiacus TaxID=60137 RepID=UPI0030EDDD23
MSNITQDILSRNSYVRAAKENAKRLFRDSVLLQKAGSWQSAAVLAVLAIEEMGKAYIEIWGVKNVAQKGKHPTHSQKQAAFFALLAANELTEKNMKRLASFGEGKMIREHGPYSEQMVHARAGFYDDLRMVCTYSDREPIWPDEITGTFDAVLVDELHSFFQKGQVAGRRKIAIKFGAILYENDFGHL